MPHLCNLWCYASPSKGSEHQRRKAYGGHWIASQGKLRSEDEWIDFWSILLCVMVTVSSTKFYYYSPCSVVSMSKVSIPIFPFCHEKMFSFCRFSPPIFQPSLAGLLKIPLCTQNCLLNRILLCRLTSLITGCAGVNEQGAHQVTLGRRALGCGPMQHHLKESRWHCTKQEKRKKHHGGGICALLPLKVYLMGVGGCGTMYALRIIMDELAK